MKLIKTSAIALAMSAMLAGPVLAQGAASDPQLRGSVPGKSQMRGGVSGSGEEEFNAQPGAAGEKGGTSTKAKGTVGAGRGTAKGATDGTVGDPTAGRQR
ncbi:hypothetical protein [Bradyrhizobium sp.]|uniref:hypothetical protein n=1 Tax=Bradyrhizobium sp. TaxID=376 RepID=UPI004037DA00